MSAVSTTARGRPAAAVDVTPASAASGVRSPRASAPCRRSTAYSIVCRPRTFLRIWTLAWLSASRTGRAR
jgi:hypothetical protein